MPDWIRARSVFLPALRRNGAATVGLALLLAGCGGSGSGSPTGSGGEAGDVGSTGGGGPTGGAPGQGGSTGS
ncbi:MAG TPA: hypothetical protein VHO06_25250, partial [Polyangia bacterium]|nr:hypothetical protein [Polyangia bacterium]